MDVSRRHVVRQKLAELLREPIERVSPETRLRRLVRYDPSVARELLRRFGVDLPEERLRQIERVRDLLDEALGEVSPPQVVTPDGEPAPGRSIYDVVAPALAALVEPPPPPPAPAAVPPAPQGTFVSPTAYDVQRIGAAAVCCSDGRLGDQTDEFLHQGLGLPRYDRVSCPGGPVALAGRLLAFWECRGVEDQLRLLIRLHDLRRVVLVAHDGCGYYRDRLGVPAAEVEQQQRLDLERAAATVSHYADGLAIETFYARRDGDRVRFEPVSPADPSRARG